MKYLFIILSLVLCNTALGQEDTETIAFTKADQPPKADYDVNQYIAEHLSSTERIGNDHKEICNVRVHFTVTKTGAIINVSASKPKCNRHAKGTEQSISDEAIRVVKSMPPWKPGLYKGRPVNIHYTLPIRFILE